MFPAGVEIQVDPGKQRFAQLYLVDLAGSERVMKTGVQGLQLEEVTGPWALVKDGDGTEMGLKTIEKV